MKMLRVRLWAKQNPASPFFKHIFLIQDEALISLKIILHYESFLSIGALRLTITNSLCTPIVLICSTSARDEQKREKTSFLRYIFM
jgi:hypothetical protein